MTFSRPVLIIFHGGTGEGPAERAVARARAAAAQLSARSALAAGFEAVIIATDDPSAFGGAVPNTFVDLDPPGPFSFDARLRHLVEHFGLEKPAVMGSGSVPLLGETEFRIIVEQLELRASCFVTNNFFSADLTAWTPGNALSRIHPVPRDNVLPRRLRDEAGLTPIILPRTTATQFDLDTPADLAVLSLHESVPPPLRDAAMAIGADLERYRAVMRVLCDREAELVVFGRVGSQTWQYLERETACRVRMLSEERGLAAAGPDHRPRSLVGHLVETVGARRFFELVAGLGDAFVCDTRVLEAHLGITPSREDRFQSDLLHWERVSDPWLREFTRCAKEAPIPVLLGGHSLVSGGIMALVDIAWSEHDRRLALL